jgi:hypothetical protein
MPYNIQHSDTTKDPISVADRDLNQETSLTFIGKNYNQSYSGIIGENFLHLLENFASHTAPDNPTEGQLWYNSTEDSIDNGLKIFDGSNWIPLGVINKSSDPPPPITQSSKFKNGDLFVDTTRQQLYVFGESVWTLVGPKYQASEKTTAEVEAVFDSFDNLTSILTLFVKNNRVAIVSDKEFIPKKTIDGFPLVRQGITLSNTKFQTASKINKFWGTSEKAESLVVGDTVVDPVNFLRSDVISTTKNKFNIRNNSGLSIGEGLTLSIELDPVTNAPVIKNNSSGSNITFRLVNKNVMTIDSRSSIAQRGSVGINNIAPDQSTSLDVVGNIKTNGSMIITGGNDSNVTNPNIPALSIIGGANVSKSLMVGTDLSVNGTSTLGNNVNINGQLVITARDITAPALLPVSPSNVFLDIGSTSQKFGNIYGQGFKGNSDSATVANYLRNGIGVIMNSDDIQMSLTEIGSIDKLTPTLAPSLNPQFIYAKSSPPDDQSKLRNEDLILISRKTNIDPNDDSQQLIKLTGADLLHSFDIATVQPGSIILWPNSSTVPPGYVLCNGQVLLKTKYQDFFDIIGATSFSDGGILKFHVPDLTSTVPAPGINYIIYTGII